MNYFKSKVLSFAAALLPLFMPVIANDSKEWDYKKQGKDWPDNFETCKSGIQQSPIDLVDSKVYVTKNL